VEFGEYLLSMLAVSSRLIKGKGKRNMNYKKGEEGRKERKRGMKREGERLGTYIAKRIILLI